MGHASEEAENWLLRVGLEGRTSMIRFVEPLPETHFIFNSGPAGCLALATWHNAPRAAGWGSGREPRLYTGREAHHATNRLVSKRATAIANCIATRRKERRRSRFHRRAGHAEKTEGEEGQDPKGCPALGA